MFETKKNLLKYESGKQQPKMSHSKAWPGSYPYGNANLGPYLTRSDLYQKLALYIWFDLGNFRSVVN